MVDSCIFCRSYNIENAELYHLGQTTNLGRYPIHFHLALDTVRDGVKQVIRGNAIHHTFRCTFVKEIQLLLTNVYKNFAGWLDYPIITR